jgi:hypothetical protein
MIYVKQVSIGSNWSSQRQNDPPKSAIIAIRQLNSKPLTTA